MKVETRNKYVAQLEAVGSRVTCNPPPTDTDQDYLVLVKKYDDFWDFLLELNEEGYDIDGSEVVPAEEVGLEEYEGFQSVSKGDVNLIVTASKDFFDAFMMATRMAKEQNLLKKEDRVKLFQKILYDVDV